MLQMLLQGTLPPETGAECPQDNPSLPILCHAWVQSQTVRHIRMVPGDQGTGTTRKQTPAAVSGNRQSRPAAGPGSQRLWTALRSGLPLSLRCLIVKYLRCSCDHILLNPWGFCKHFLWVKSTKVRACFLPCFRHTTQDQPAAGHFAPATGPFPSGWNLHPVSRHPRCWQNQTGTAAFCTRHTNGRERKLRSLPGKTWVYQAAEAVCAGRITPRCTSSPCG